MSELNGSPQIPPQLSLKRNVIPTPSGLKVVYCFTDGTFVASFDIYAAGQQAQQIIPSLLTDLAKALTSQLVQPTPEDLSKFTSKPQ